MWQYNLRMYLGTYVTGVRFATIEVLEIKV